jgi:PAS domain-containing protein
MDKDRQRTSLERIIHLASQLLITFDIEELLTNVVREAKDLLGAEGATLYLIDQVEKLMISQVILSDRVEEIVLDIDNTSIAGFTALSRHPLIIPDVYADLSSLHPSLCFNKAIDEATHHRTLNMITNPLEINGELIGVFQIVNKPEPGFTPDDLVILQNFSTIAGIAIMNARLMERILDEQGNAFDIIENISDRVLIQDREGRILHLNRRAAEGLPDGTHLAEVKGKALCDVFPQCKGFEPEIRKVIDQNLDKKVAGGKTPFVILTSKNSRKLVEKVILIIKDQKAPLATPETYPTDPADDHPPTGQES